MLQWHISFGINSCYLPSSQPSIGCLIYEIEKYLLFPKISSQCGWKARFSNKMFIFYAILICTTPVRCYTSPYMIHPHIYTLDVILIDVILK